MDEPGKQSERVRHKLARFQLVPNPFALLTRFVHMYQLLRAAKPLCIHAHTTRGAFLPLLAGYLQRIPVRIYHNHGSAYWGRRGLVKKMFGVLERLLCGLATHILMVNPTLKEVFVNDGLA